MKRFSIVFLIVLLSIMTFDSVPVMAVTDEQYECTTNYSVEQIITNNDYIQLECFSTYNEAKKYFDENKKETTNIVIRHRTSSAPNKIVAMDFGYAIATGGATVNVYNNPNLTTNAYIADFSTYVTKNVKMYYYETVVNSAGNLVYKVSVSGYTGYVSSTVTDLLPWTYVEKDYPFKLRSGTFSKTDANYYQVRTTGGVREIYYYSGVVGGTLWQIGPIGPAPDWLSNGIYYSDNMSQFYQDFQRSKPVADGKKYYNYYQYLPLRSRSTLTGADLDRYLASVGFTDSVYYGKSVEFINNQNKYGMNGLLVFALANLESAFGRSYYATTRNNIFGWQAYDGSPDDAMYFASVEQAIKEHMSVNLFGYTNINDSRFTSPALGNKGAGFNTKYASDPDWGLKIAALAYQADKFAGLKDYNYYSIGLIDDHTSANVYASNSFNSKRYYHTRGEGRGLINQTIAITRKVGDFYEATTWFPIINGEPLTTHNYGAYINNIDTSLGYIHDSVVTVLNNGKWQALPAGTLPESSLNPPPEIVEGESASFKVIAEPSLNVRSQPSTSSSIIGSLTTNTIVEGTYVNNNTWVKITYNNQTGYISSSYVEKMTPVEPEPVNEKEYRVTASAGLIVRSTPSTSGSNLGVLSLNEVFKGVAVENNTWIKLSYQGKDGYVSAEYVELVAPPTNKIDVAKTLGYTASGSILTGMNLSTTINSVASKLKAIDSSITISVTDGSGKAKDVSSHLVTGDKLVINQTGQSAQTFTIAVKGDISGDGVINAFDVARFHRHFLKTQLFNSYQLIASDINNDGDVNAFDLARMHRHLQKTQLIH